MQNKNIVIVGDGMVGKTCLLHTYTEGFFLTDYIPTIYDKEAKELRLDGKLYNVRLHDTAGQEDYERLRVLSYKDADAFILCYSSTERNSFENIMSKWAPEIRVVAPYVPIVLVATKIDLRDNATNGRTTNAITTEEGERLRKKLKANTFIECSAKEFKNINEVIYEAVRASDRPIISDDEKESCNFCTRITKMFKK